MHAQHRRSSDARTKRPALGWLLCCALALASACEKTPRDEDAQTTEMDAGRKPPKDEPSKLLDSSLLPPDLAADSGTDATPQDAATDSAAPQPSAMPDSATPPAPDASEPMPPQAGTVAPPPPPAIAADPGEAGPWPVGVQTLSVTLATGQTPVEVWYPAKLGSEAGKFQEIYDFIEWLPPEAQEEVPAAEKPVPVLCNCYRDLPIDSEHGPYPVVIFAHNVGAFRVSSVGIMAHWASRGFIVLALDHPRLHLQDVLAYASYGACTGSGLTDDAERTRDIGALLAAVRNPTGGFAFLSGVADATNIAVAGHSDGAAYAAAASGQAGVRLIMIWNYNTTVPQRGDLEAVAYFASGSDTYPSATPSRIESAYRGVDYRAFHINTRRAGHISMTELCNSKNSAGRDGMAIARRYSLCDLDFTLLAWAAWDCSATYLDQGEANEIFGFSTTAVLEAVLKDEDETASWTKFRTEWGTAEEKNQE